MSSYRLQSVLDYRQMLEDQAQEQLVDVLERERSCVYRMRQEQRELNMLCQEKEEQQRQGIYQQDLFLLESRIRYQSMQLIELQKQLETITQEIDTCRHHLQEKCKDKKLLKVLKEKYQETQRQEFEKKESKALDEIGILYYSR
jgi:flagellar FliJ protein